MKKYLQILLALSIVLSSGCTNQHLITSNEYQKVVEKSFNERNKLAGNREKKLFSVFDQKLSVKETEALKYLFAFMPLSDLADYSGDYFLANANLSLRSRDETPWGKEIPEEIFLHYVLPVRVNNENLDSFRIVYFDEISNRVKGKHIREAALEINHWCHEKVNYQPADIRTSSPMFTILSARGRCGEESTFTVAALRTAGIPARQVYTPRWAHSDDNHAWVEVWDNGSWYYMGACEPEPVLDLGWFTEPARRAMLVHTKSFGAPSGNENIITRQKKFSDINNLSKYAPTKKIFVKVLNMDGFPLNNAKVEFQLYNYAEFYPLATIPTDQSGICQFETGLGDLLIWAHKENEFDFRKITVNETDTIVLKLNRKAEGNSGIDLDLGVPVKPAPLITPSKEIMNQNTSRIDNENIIRQKYIDSWMNPSGAKSLAKELNLDSTRIMNIISRSMGNFNEIRLFLKDTPDTLRQLALSLLEVLPDKDLRDTKREILSDHLKNSNHPDYLTGEQGNKMFISYILNPRVANEMLVGWRGYFQDKLPALLLKNGMNDPLLIVDYLNKNLLIADDENYYGTPLTPIGVIELKVSDSDSRSIAFVAICRALGIPSRLEPGSNVPQYFFKSDWVDVFFSDQEKPVQKKGFLKLVSDVTKPVPEYYTNFTLARFENGRYNTLEYDYNKKISDFTEELQLFPGHYMLVTGNRLNDSKILSNISFFDLSENEHKIIRVNPRKEVLSLKIIYICNVLVLQ
jgi:Transglutaminase-like superfamily